MKLSTVLSLAALSHLSLADFYLFRVESNGDSGYQISDNSNPSCEELGPNTPWYGAKANVDGSTLGVTCAGAGCVGNENPGGIDAMHMHFSNNPEYRWKISKNGGYRMTAGDGADQGVCELSPGYTYSCPSNNNHVDLGFGKFHCKVYASAAQIKEAK